jgi:3'-phosphoadenosine 5'-phosphosulfate sulfotransferase (PAPS reductase)/FAD synthetase
MQQLIDLRNETPEAIALQAIGAFMDAGRPAIVLFSGGKDSSVLLNLALTAASEQAKQGRKALVVIAHSDVGVENPEIQRLVSGEIAKASSVRPRARRDGGGAGWRRRPSGTRFPCG